MTVPPDHPKSGLTIRPAAGSTRRDVAVCAAFAVGLALYEIILLSPDQDRENVLELFTNGSHGMFVKSLILSAVSLMLVAFFVLVARRGGIFTRIILAIAFATAMASEYAHHAALNRFSHYSTAAVGVYGGEWSVAVKALAMYFNPWCLPPILGLILILIVSAKQPRPALGTVLSGASVAFAALTAFLTSNAYATIAPWAFVRTAIGYPIIWHIGRAGTDAFRAPSRVRQQLVPVTGLKPSNNIVLIVDESVRADHLHLNGYRSTQVRALTELMARGDLVNFGIAAAGSTCSRSSNNLLLTGLKDLPDRSFKIYELPTIFQYARAMGYKTYEFDGQVSSVWKGTYADLKMIDHRETPLQLSDNVPHQYKIDGEIGRRVSALVSNSVGNFIWIGKRGVHLPYADAYPRPGGPLSKMALITYNKRTSRKALVADYDSAIKYNLNLFFDQLLVNRRPAPATKYIYTSDHGQSLRDGGVVASHCSVTRPEAMVPLILLGSDISDFGWQTRYKASHANIFPTLLDWMNVPARSRAYDYAVSLAKARQGDSTRRYYFDHDLSGEDGGKGYPFD